MTTKRYCVFVVPVAHKAAADLLMALVNGDDPSASHSFSRGANADGSWNDEENLYELATHFFGGMPVSEEWEATVSNLAANIPTPPGGWPWNGITQQQGEDAAAAIHLQVTITQDGSTPNPATTLANAMAALNLVPITGPE